MVLWRISRHRDLNGLGGLWVNGRWHHAGQPVVYLSDSPASAVLEVCVHTAANDVPPDFMLLRIEGPDIAAASVAPQRLPRGWQQDAGATRDIGTEWLRSRRSVLLKVPSAIVPETNNYLFNPLHRGAETFRIAATYAWHADPRFMTGAGPSAATHPSGLCPQGAPGLPRVPLMSRPAVRARGRLLARHGAPGPHAEAAPRWGVG